VRRRWLDDRLPRSRALHDCCNSPRRFEFPLAGIVPLESLPERSRREDRALATAPALLAFLVFRCTGIVWVTALAFLAMTSVESEGHMGALSHTLLAHIGP
jgi:hypothetical protein